MVDRASILNNDKDNNVITLELNNKLLKITSMSLEIGKVEEKMETNCDENIKISFSGKYMLEALRTLKKIKKIKNKDIKSYLIFIYEKVDSGLSRDLEKSLFY